MPVRFRACWIVCVAVRLLIIAGSTLANVGLNPLAASDRPAAIETTWYWLTAGYVNEISLPKKTQLELVPCVGLGLTTGETIVGVPGPFQEHCNRISLYWPSVTCSITFCMREAVSLSPSVKDVRSCLPFIKLMAIRKITPETAKTIITSMIV